MGVMKAWEAVFGSESDFLNKDLQKETVLANMNQFATLLESTFPGQPLAMLGHVLIEACRFTAARPKSTNNNSSTLRL